MATHRYPTRWRLARQISISISQAHGEENNGKRTKQERHIQHLPDDILFNILVLVPPKLLHDVVRYVCKHWNHIIDDPNFITAHRESSSSGGLLLQNPMRLLHATYIEGDSPELNVTKFDLPFPSEIVGSRNGLLLLHDRTGNKDVLHVVNPVTKAKISLPPLKGLFDLACGTCLAVASSGHYKVVNITGVHASKEPKMRVFTVGIDKAWRCIDLVAHGLHMEETVGYVFPCRPCVTDEKWVYWYSVTNFFGFALNIDDETIYQFHKPKDYVYVRNQSRFIRLGTGLGVVEHQADTWTVWELTDAISGKWSKMTEIRNMEAEINRIDESLHPRNCFCICPLRFVNGYFWFHRHADEDYAVVRYNVDDKSFKMFMIRSLYKRSVLHPHVPTLVSPKNCFTIPSR